MLPQIHQGVMNYWHILKKFLKEDEIVKSSNGWNLLSSRPQIKNKGLAQQKEGGKKGRSPSSFYQKATSWPTSARREEEKDQEWEETILHKLQDSKNPRICHEKCLEHGQNLDRIQG
ncbi:hypothetical protein O181_002815 [Austropuccinia psidii MF-1]|uniref:Uncharacterized protein n=1 Tax=Austropuccinia psidii MF-1 TaxID=1389203 RepID=A0A9Q3BD67_9BASI|nr:hypothetical protein [Austropuccinia psidii MF-1]